MGIDLSKNNSNEGSKKDAKINLSKNSSSTNVPNASNTVLKKISDNKEPELSTQRTYEAKDNSAKKNSGKWIVIVIILIAAVGLIYLFTKSGSNPNSEISNTDKNITGQKNNNSEGQTTPNKDVNNTGKDVKDPGKDVNTNDKKSDVNSDSKNSGNETKDNTKNLNSNKDPNKDQNKDPQKDENKDSKKENKPNNNVSRDGMQKNTSDDKQNKLSNNKQNKTQNNTKIEDNDNIANFVPSGTKLTKKSIVKLNVIVKQLKDNKNISATITGYTDNKGSDELNKKLSEKRAKVVYNYLIRRGIDASRLKSTGEGSSNPISDNSTPEGRYKNRRVSVNLK